MEILKVTSEIILKDEIWLENFIISLIFWKMKVKGLIQ